MRKKARIVLTQAEREALISNAIDSKTEKRLTAKQYLSQIQRLDVAIRQKKEEHENLLLLAQSFSGIRYDDIRVQSSAAQDKMAAKVTTAVDLEAQIMSELRGFLEKRHTVINQIQGLANPAHIELLYKRYVQYKPLEVIAVEMGYTYVWTKTIHGDALRIFEETYLNIPKLPPNCL